MGVGLGWLGVGITRYTCEEKPHPSTALGKPEQNLHHEVTGLGGGMRIHKRFIYEADTSTHAQGTDPRVAL